MKPDSNTLMVHFRWITPLLLAVSVFLLQDIFFDFKKLKSDFAEKQLRDQERMSSIQIELARVKTYLTKRIDR